MPTSVVVSRRDTRVIDPTDVAGLLHALLNERKSQRAQLAELQATVDDLTGHVDGDSVLSREMAERSIVRGLEVIAYVEHAIGKIAAGTYGTCERCNGPIASARLEAIPYARHCVSCPPPKLRPVA